MPQSPSGDPVPSITEADATGDVATLYTDIRATLGVPVVNLIWRHVATMPGGLAFAWQSVRPLYLSGAISAEATALRAGLARLNRPGLTRATLASVGLSASDLAGIDTVLESYERSNAMNMIAVAALLAFLKNDTPPASPAAPAAAPSPQPPLEGELPALPAPGQLAPDTVALIDDLNLIGRRTKIVPTMYRHLSHWPPYLALIHVLLRPLDENQALEPIITGVIDEARARAGPLVATIAHPPAGITPATRADLEAALETFLLGPLAKMNTIAPLIRNSMPR